MKFLFNTEWTEVLNGYPAEVRLEVYDAIIRYVQSGTLSELKPIANMAFSFIKNEIDYNTKQYEETCKKRSEAGKKGMAIRYQKEHLTSDNKTNKCYQKVTNLTDNDNDNDILKKPLSNESVKKSATNVATLAERKQSFALSLTPYLAKYSRDMLNDFYAYWTEENQSRTKMRFELEKTWGLGNRLATWAKRENNFKQSSNGTNFKSYQQIEREHREEQDKQFANHILQKLVSAIS